MALDHVSICVPAESYDERVAFFEKILKPLGSKKLMSFDKESRTCGFGSRFPSFWIHSGPRTNETSTPKKERSGVHIAFSASTRAQVDAFHAAAIAAGAKDNGAPGIRPYHRMYYGAFVIDADGNNIEAVNHCPMPSWKVVVPVLVVVAAVILQFSSWKFW
eukprot:GILK01007436.1.p1 GENE.GILK01007436.1~~GILK01007436.1.p1  ORF type:complete len:161 (+),score=13.43 GILK01007436.1:45-527(+)